MKALLIIVGCIVALLLMLAAGGYLLWRQHGDEPIRVVNEAMRDGEAYGKANSDTACHERSIELMQACNEFQCSLYNRGFAAACFKHASTKGDLCERVPERPGITETLRWVTEQCTQVAPYNSQCGGVMQEAIKHCNRQVDP